MDDLTTNQRAAVEHVDGPLLILAGPGSGKTRVVTRRIAHLVNEAGVHPRNILAITFTNKAAGEMSERVRQLLPNSKLWVSTFHKYCARLLREYGELVGLNPSFSILDTSDQKQAMKLVMQELDYDTTHYTPNKIRHRISNLKNDLITPEMFVEHCDTSVGDHLQTVVKRVYPAYQKWLLEANSVDFDDLLLHAAMLLNENEELRKELDFRNKYILVDEYQDTNMTQYKIVSAMSQINPNLCVTGDPDQSIYGWRGAKIENILRFERDYLSAKTIRLEENFRSTQSILRSADSLIVYNSQRKAKSLISQKPQGDPVKLLMFTDSQTEAEGISLIIREMIDAGDYNWSQIAVFYRVNALSRQLEMAMMRHRIPCQVVASTAFYDRTEVKDLLAYLRLIDNPLDQTAFFRVVNKPLRGLGKTSQNRLFRFAELNNLTLLQACARAYDVPQLSKAAATKFRAFATLIENLSLADAGSVGELLHELIEKTRFTYAWDGSSDEGDRDRLANVEELIAAARLYDSIAGDEKSLQGFLEQTALVNETDWIDDDAGRVTLMSLHAAKGLEFPVVFIVGVEEGLIPHERSTRDNSTHAEFEEERRLLFVGMTRAQELLYLTESKVRSMHGKSMPTIRSPFIQELECEQVSFGVDDNSEQLPAPSPVLKQKINLSHIPLTTGAHLLAGEKVAVAIPQGFTVGMAVRHPKYGRGTVTASDGFGARRTVTVLFGEGEREETFVSAKAPLQPLGKG